MLRRLTKKSTKRRASFKCSFSLEDFEGHGMSWASKYIGSIPVSELYTQEECEGAMKTAKDKVKSGKYNQYKKKLKVFVRVSVEGLATIDVKTGSFVSKNKVHRIVGWYGDPRDREVFGIVVKNEGGIGGDSNSFTCIVLKSKQALSALAGIKQLMAIIFSVPTVSAEDAAADERARTPTQEGVWACPDCRYSNPDAEIECVMCGCAKPEDAAGAADTAPTPEAEGLPTGKVMSVPANNRLSLGPLDEDAVAAAPAEQELPPIECFRTTHDPDELPDYINLPRGIEAVELAKDSGLSDYVNLAETVAENEAYLEQNDIMALTNEALAQEMERRMSMTPEEFASLPKNMQEETKAFNQNNPFSRISLWEKDDDDSDDDGGGGGAKANNPFGADGGRMPSMTEEDELGLDDELDDLWGAKESSNPHNPF